MAINISNLQSNAPNQVNSNKLGAKLSNSDTASSTKAPDAKQISDPVSLTSDAKQLSAMQKQLIDAPADNSDKIAALKQAVADGSYKIDSTKLAQNISSFETQLNNSLFG